MKSIIVAVAMMSASLTFAQQNQEKTPEEKAKIQTERMKTQLALTPDQESKVYEINLKEIKAMNDVRNDAALTEDTRREKTKAIREERKAEFDAVLTAEQKEKMAAQRPAAREAKIERKMKVDRTPEQKATDLTEKMTTELGLTDVQKSKVYRINLTHIQKAEAIRTTTGLTDEQRKEQLQEVHKSEKAALKEVLTSDQLKKLKELKEEHKEGKEPRKK